MLLLVILAQFCPKATIGGGSNGGRGFSGCDQLNKLFGKETLSNTLGVAAS
jgi:hypothetical protein